MFRKSFFRTTLRIVTMLVVYGIFLSLVITNSTFVFEDNEQVQDRSIRVRKRDIPALCHGKGFKPQISVPMEIDVFSKKPIKLDQNYKNPCFHIHMNNKKIPSTKLICLPYFFIIGMPKCGTTDFWHKLLQHPQIVAYHRKEPQWFSVNPKRFDRQVLDDYFRIFERTSAYIQAGSKWKGKKMTSKNNLITGEATVDTMFEHKLWQQFPENINCNEPIQINAHIIKELNPKIKLIVMIRNPIERLYSDYLFQSRWLKYDKSKYDFHHEIMSSIKRHLDCRHYFTMRGCAYNSTIDSVKTRLRIGMYNIYLEEWFRVFPRNQFFILKFEDYIKQPIYFIKKAVKFLNISDFTKAEIEILEKSKPLNKRNKVDVDLGDMLPETRRMLESFYQPFNHQLNKLMMKKIY